MIDSVDGVYFVDAQKNQYFIPGKEGFFKQMKDEVRSLGLLVQAYTIEAVQKGEGHVSKSEKIYALHAKL